MNKFYPVLVIAYLCAAARCPAAQDPASLSINEKTLVAEVNKTPLDTPEAELLIRRAFLSGCSKAAYDAYKSLWNKAPAEPYANLRLGDAAEYYWEYATRPDIHLLSIQSKDAEQVFKIAQDCLTKAVSLKPNLPETNVAYGYFLFWHGGDMSRGIMFLNIAVSIDPTCAAAHEVLGNAYATASGDYYDPRKALQELNRSIELDRRGSFAHWRLVRVYLDLGQYQDAEQELKIYKTLVPSAVAEKFTRSYTRELQNRSKTGNLR